MELFAKELRQVSPQTLGIVWSDGHNSIVNVRKIRLDCRCAHCVDEWSREKILDETKVPLDVRPKKIDSVGRYAFQITWSDGHDTGIFTFSHLRDLCECPQCKKACTAH